MDKATAYFELAVSLHLWRWQALTLAVDNEWGGADSAEKRDWLAGTLADLYSPDKETDVEDVEDVVVQVMGDEFSVLLEDDSAYELAKAIDASWRDCREGKFDAIEAMKQQFESRPAAVKKQRTDDDDSSSESGTDGEIDAEAGDNDRDAMEIDARPAEATARRPEPIIDDDGFELVQKGRR